MLVLLALLDGHGIPGAMFDTQSVSVYLGGAAVGFGTPVDTKAAWDALLTIERVGLISISQAQASPVILMSPVVQAAIRLAAPPAFHDRAARTAASALVEAWPAEESHSWTAAALRANAVSLHGAATDVLWAEGCHPVLMRAGRSLDSARLADALIAAAEPDDAVTVLRRAVAESEQFRGVGHQDTLAIRA